MTHRFATLSLVLAITGCFEIKQKIQLQPNLSGTAHLTMAVNLEPLISMSLMGEGEISATERQQKLEQELDKIKKEDGEGAAATFAHTKRKMPKGTELEKLEVTFDGFTAIYDARIRFDHVAKLEQIQFVDPKKEEKKGGPGAENPLEKPFEGLSVQETKGVVTIESGIANPARNDGEGEGEAEMGKMVEKIFAGTKVSFTIELPHAPLDHNATRVEGNTLHWEYDWAALRELARAKQPHKIRVRFSR